MGSWHLERLQAMDAAEVALRTRRALAARVDAAAWHAARPLWRRAWLPGDGRLLVTRPLLDRPLGVLDAGRAALLAQQYPDAAAAIVGAAERVLTGRVRVLGYPAVTLPDPPDWSRDPFTGRTWPDRHAKLVDYRKAEPGDPKWIWELNRLQEVPLLALAWRLSADGRYAEAGVRRMLAWIERSVPSRGIAWSNGLEAGLRAISLALGLDCLRGSEALDAGAARAVLRSLWQHARFTLRDLSPPSSANNHLVGELAGLAVVGLLAPELGDAEGFRDRGLAGLAREAQRQVLGDGTGAEQAFAYQLFVLDFLVLVVALAAARSVDVPAEVPAAIARSAGALAMQVQGAEPDPAYGDADDGRAFVLDAAERRDARAVLATIGAYLGRGGAAPDPTGLLLFGMRSRAGDLDEARDTILPDSGLVVLRRRGTRVLFDAGPLGYLRLAAHGHADALQVTLADEEIELVGDPGTGSYYGDPVRRAAFRGTSFHATVAVDGLDQAEQAGPFLWRHHYHARLHQCDLEAGVVVGSHDGYMRLPDPVGHVRALLVLEDGTVLVVDSLASAGAHRYVQTWPLDPALEAILREGSAAASLDGECRLHLFFASTAAGALRLRRGESEPPAGWWSRRLEHVDPSWTVSHEVECSGGAILVALLVVARGQACADPQLTVRGDGRTAEVAFVHEGRAHRLELDTGDRLRPVRVDQVSSEPEAVR
jgi:hypothetical protein